MKQKTSPEKQLALKLAEALGDAKDDQKRAIKEFQKAAKTLNTTFLGAELRNAHYHEGIQYGVCFAAGLIAEYFTQIEKQKKGTTK